MGGVFGALGECPLRALRLSCGIYFAYAAVWTTGYADAHYTWKTMCSIGKRKEVPKIHLEPKKRTEQVASALAQKRKEEKHAHEVR